MQNLAGFRDPDPVCTLELNHAGIPITVLPESLRARGEVTTRVVGFLHGWAFERAWCYWVAKGPGLPFDVATDLHARHGNVVRVDGHCACPSPLEWFRGLGVGHYHVDTGEGLKALADAVKAVVARHADASPPAGKST